MAVETIRKCGFRKVGGIYLVAGEGGFPCDRLPIALDVCPCCGGGVKFARGFTWIQPYQLFDGNHGDGCQCRVDGPKQPCPACFPSDHFNHNGKAGLLWVGEKHYTPEEFQAEAMVQGVSKRISTVPHGFEVGMWIFLAHKKGRDKIIHNAARDTVKVVKAPAIFFAFRPQRVERIVLQSEYNLWSAVTMHLDAADGDVNFVCQLAIMLGKIPPMKADDAEAIYNRLQRDVKRGLTLIPVPDNDTDHQ